MAMNSVPTRPTHCDSEMIERPPSTEGSRNISRLR